MVVGNADDMAVHYGFKQGVSTGVAEYLPESEDELIVFTTRFQGAAVALAGSDVIELDEMEQEIISIMSREFHDSTRYKGSKNVVATTWLVSSYQPTKLTTRVDDEGINDKGVHEGVDEERPGYGRRAQPSSCTPQATTK